MRDRVAELTVRADRKRHETLSPDVLRDVLASRARHRPIDAYTAAAAAEREQRFLAASAAYRRLADDEPARRQRLEELRIDGLPWWMPLEERLPERAERTTRQGFPYRVILQTRELAVGGLMVDLGGNIGRTCVTRALLGDVRAVYAAEPEPLNYAALVQNVVTHGLRGLVLPDQIAVGAARGEVRLYRSRFMGGHRVLSGESEPDLPVVTVPCWPLDEWLEHVGCEARAVTFVKVDVQGSEIGVLGGATQLLARRQAAWQMELDPELLRKAGHEPGELMALLERHFTQFIDIGTPHGGVRLRPIAELRDAIAYVGGEQSKTDLLLYAA
jgi:FkbM family methyltransferase